MKKIIALLLLVALTLTVLAACNNVGDDTSKEAGSKADESEAVVDKDAAWKDENGNYVPKVKKDMQGATFTIVVRGDKYGTYRSDDFFVAEDSIYGDRLRNAVNKRNERVKQDYNVELNLIRSDDIYNEVTNDIDSGLAEYDAIMPTMRNLATLASDNKLLDLTEINGLDINAPWYDKNVTEAFSIKGCVYFTAGDITILNKVNCCSILFSKEIIANNTALENPYDLVKSNQWTYDKLVEMGKAVANTNSTDLNQRTYGMLGHANDVYSIFVGCSNEPIVIKDDDDLPVINFDNSNERAVKNTQKVLDSYVNGSDWIIYSNNTEFGTGAAMWDNSLAYFGNGHALFRPSYFSATTKLRQRSEKLFGIVPVPKLEEYQDDYYTYCTTGETAGIAIPIT
ncbi:MAG: extracellular solute-binding protein, partial [Clostridia bacterium]|nr:extracellular solute-binding protein [Clostridia bacterium]